MSRAILPSPIEGRSLFPVSRNLSTNGNRETLFPQLTTHASRLATDRHVDRHDRERVLVVDEEEILVEVRLVPVRQAGHLDHVLADRDVLEVDLTVLVQVAALVAIVDQDRAGIVARDPLVRVPVEDDDGNVAEARLVLLL